MTKQIETLVEDIEALFDGHDLAATVEKFSDDLALMFLKRFQEYGTERKPSLRLSSIGKPLRQIWYEMHGAPAEELTPETKLKFLYGSLIEELMIYLAIEAGHDVQFLQKEVSLDGVVGHIDCIIDGVLVDVKSCSTYSFMKFQTGGLRYDDPFGYIAQITGYREALSIERCGFLAVDKTLGRLCFYEVSDNDYDVRTRIKDVREAVAQTTEPVRCYQAEPVSNKDKTGNMVLPFQCAKYCRWRDHCWRDANDGRGLEPRFYSTGVKYFTKLVVEPRLKYETREEFPTKGENS